ncbi:MBL fold metallo-hydrolase [Metabacillus litoralis]|uniref:MBL fold metallo-hydrolase n=1 Tax=Metabacillus litoralis TaxID=152268 RepID=A0A5C6W6S8_9BACI|nr:MBL fold metallo-hydrolase [Metabacillus litoralis]TXC93043.1 MBL fold metallo-hydrolase [Metabacillus litoralis]
MKQIGPIKIIEGPNYSKVPYSRSLFIDGAEKVLIDTGADPSTLSNLEQKHSMNLIINTHYHPDHTCHNYLFPNTEKWINPIEFETVSSIESVAKENGIFQEWGKEGVDQWKKTIPDEWITSLLSINGTYEYDKQYNFGDVNMILLHTPGHTKGFACPYFPDLGVVYTGDYDMTAFGPWYNGTDGDIEDFVRSGQRLLNLDADVYITGHQKGVFTKTEFKSAMSDYLAIIDQRDDIISKHVQSGMDFEKLSSIGIFYPKKTLEHTLLRTWERSGIRKHLERLGYIVKGTEIKSYVRTK